MFDPNITKMEPCAMPEFGSPGGRYVAELPIDEMVGWAPAWIADTAAKAAKRIDDFT
jgi:hypothetical protein